MRPAPFYRTAAATAVLTAALSWPATVQAQTHAFDTGALRVGGNASISSVEAHVGDQSTGRATNITIAPLLQYFVIPGLAVGGTLTLERHAGDGYTSNNWRIGPSASWYFYTPARSIHPYLSAGASIGRLSVDVSQETVRRDLTGFRGAAGGLYQLGSNVGLTGEFFYDHTRMAEGDNDLPARSVNTRAFGFAAGFSIFLF